MYLNKETVNKVLYWGFMLFSCLCRSYIGGEKTQTSFLWLLNVYFILWGEEKQAVVYNHLFPRKWPVFVCKAYASTKTSVELLLWGVSSNRGQEDVQVDLPALLMSSIRNPLFLEMGSTPFLPKRLRQGHCNPWAKSKTWKMEEQSQKILCWPEISHFPQIPQLVYSRGSKELDVVVKALIPSLKR